MGLLLVFIRHINSYQFKYMVNQGIIVLYCCIMAKAVGKAGASGCAAPTALGQWVQAGAEKALFDTS